MRRWYQNIDGIEGTYEDPNRKESKFWNEGKWNNYIKPLLPNIRGTFIEIGCNAGLFLKMAVDEGFRNVIGIESNPKIMEQAEIFKNTNKYNYKLIQQMVGGDFELNKLPLANIILFSNVHYHLPIPAFVNLVDHIKNKTIYCIVVSAKTRSRSGKPKHYLTALKGYFRDWQVVKVIEELDEKNDPAPRKQMYSIIFKGNLDVCNVKELCNKWYSEVSKSRNYKHRELPLALEEFFGRVLTEEPFSIRKTALYKYWMKRSSYISSKWTYKKLAYKKSLLEDIKKNGMKDPIYFDQRGKLLDGIHRLSIAKALGYEYIIARKI